MDTTNNDSSRHQTLFEESIQEVVRGNLQIRETVRYITLKALSEGKLDLQEIAEVSRKVVNAAAIGATIDNLNSREKLAGAIAGLDDALCCAAEASKLAVEEAIWNMKSFTDKDLRLVIDELAELENIYLNTLISAAEDGNEVVINTLNDLARHGRSCGTAVGQRTTEIINALNHELAGGINKTVTGGTESAIHIASNLAFAGAGFLDAIAQTLDAKLKSKSYPYHK